MESLRLTSIRIHNNITVNVKLAFMNRRRLKQQRQMNMGITGIKQLHHLKHRTGSGGLEASIPAEEINTSLSTRLGCFLANPAATTPPKNRNEEATRELQQYP